jgi:hypothetical protein
MTPGDEILNALSVPLFEAEYTRFAAQSKKTRPPLS